MSATHLYTETPADTPDADALIARAFGPGRYAKTAERLREGRSRRPDLCVVARHGGRLVGCVRQWPVRVGEADALLLGPIAVDAECRSHGLGAALVRRACEVADAAGFAHIVLVGDEAFFGPMGFAVARGVELPGPVDRRRVLARATGGEALSGCVRAVASRTGAP